jgi:uncharacterized protein YceH (UPF0502 family)
MELLDPVEARVLGALMEKEVTTPDYYPLSLNALVNACNQKSNREPVVDYDQNDVEDAVTRLREKQFCLMVTGNGRVSKYQQRISETLNLGRRESAILCTLLLRGPQTLGEIKDRSERMFRFTDLAETELVLDKLADLPGGALTVKLARQSGQKEVRFAHLLCGELKMDAAVEAPITAGPPGKLAQLELELQQVRAELSELKLRFDALEAQFK